MSPFPSLNPARPLPPGKSVGSKGVGNYMYALSDRDTCGGGGGLGRSLPASPLCPLCFLCPPCPPALPRPSVDRRSSCCKQNIVRLGPDSGRRAAPADRPTDRPTILFPPFFLRRLISQERISSSRRAAALRQRPPATKTRCLGFPIFRSSTRILL